MTLSITNNMSYYENTLQKISEENNDFNKRKIQQTKQFNFQEVSSANLYLSPIPAPYPAREMKDISINRSDHVCSPSTLITVAQPWRGLVNKEP